MDFDEQLKSKVELVTGDDSEEGPATSVTPSPDSPTVDSTAVGSSPMVHSPSVDCGVFVLF
jgi:hypothetical protein